MLVGGMELQVGHIIKSERIRQGMKQIVLARGICTPSYLSRIEQNQITASEEIITLLLEKLGININEIIEEKDDENEPLLLELQGLYKEVIQKRDSDFAKEQLANPYLNSKLLEDSELYYTYNLIMIRFKLIAGEDLSVIKRDIELIREQEGILNERQKFLLEVNEAILLYEVNNSKKAISHLEKVVNMGLKLDDWEQADVNYMLGLAYISDNRMAISLEYIELAQEYFKNKLLVKRVLDCLTLKGIYYKRIKNFIEAEKCYFEAIELCKEFSIREHLGRLYHNLGSFYLSNSREKDGISYMLDSLKYKSEPKSKLITIHSLVITYSKMNNTDKVIHWCEEGLSLCENIFCKSIKPYFYHFNFYKSLHSKDGLTSDVVKNTLTYFVSLEDYRNARKYAIAFAVELYNEGKYKLASTFFMKANNYKYVNKEIETWEDI